MILPSAYFYAGVEYRQPDQDCYALMRQFFSEQLGVELGDYPRPSDWFDNKYNLFMENYAKEGFRLIDVSFNLLQIGDVLLCAIGSPLPNHCAIYVGGNHVLHHLINRHSSVDPLSRLLRNNTMAVIRHPGITLPEIETKLIELHEVNPDEINL